MLGDLRPAKEVFADVGADGYARLCERVLLVHADQRDPAVARVGVLLDHATVAAVAHVEVAGVTTHLELRDGQHLDRLVELAGPGGVDLRTDDAQDEGPHVGLHNAGFAGQELAATFVHEEPAVRDRVATIEVVAAHDQIAADLFHVEDVLFDLAAVVGQPFDQRVLAGHAGSELDVVRSGGGQGLLVRLDGFATGGTLRFLQVTAECGRCPDKGGFELHEISLVGAFAHN